MEFITNMKSSDGLAYDFQKGEGKPVIFIHGWLGSRKFWKLITPYLELENPLVFYDQRCHNDSNCSKFSMETLANDLHCLVNELDLEDPILVGHSMGGMTALSYASKYENFSGLCLLGTSASTPDPEHKSVKYFLDKFNELPRDEWADKITENYVASSEKEEIKQMTRNELIEANEKPIEYGLEAMLSYDVREKLKHVSIPALVIAAEKDGAITMEKSEELADLLDCRLETVNTSHQMLPEEPEKIASFVEDFVKEIV